MNATDCVGDYQAVRGNLSQMVAHCSHGPPTDTSQCTLSWNALQSADCMSDCKLTKNTACGMAYADMMNATDCVGDYQAVRGNLSQMVAHCSANQANLAKCTQYWNVLQNASNGCMSDTAGPDCSKLTDPADVCGMAYMGMMSATDCVGDYQAVKGNL